MFILFDGFYSCTLTRFKYLKYYTFLNYSVAKLYLLSDGTAFMAEILSSMSTYVTGACLKEDIICGLKSQLW